MDFFDPYFLTSVFSLVFISLYNGNRGIKMKYLFYIFYPLHLLILYLVSILLIKTL
ncbi:TraX family protein [Sellimonas intestinalis]|uniref:TraX family protein n=1 Tax=Sellimonas intestinalis TaxID=1653434 RepID=UPI0039905F8A